MDTYEAVTTRRSIRLFEQKPIPPDVMERILNAGRLAPTGGNVQPLEFAVVEESANRAAVFEQMKWAAYVQPRRTPGPNQRPVAHIVVLVNEGVASQSGWSSGAAAVENMMLVAWNEGVGSCWVGAVDRDKVKDILGIPKNVSVFGVVALGYAAEQPVAEEMTDSHKYWLDDDNVLHVPKRKLCDIVHREKFGQRG